MLFPQPDGPISETNSPVADLQIDPVERVHLRWARPALNTMSTPRICTAGAAPLAAMSAAVTSRPPAGR